MGKLGHHRVKNGSAHVNLSAAHVNVENNKSASLPLYGKKIYYPPLT